MSYKIIYQSNFNKSSQINRKKRRVYCLSMTFFMLFLLLVKSFWESGNAVISTVFLGNRGEIIEKIIQYTQNSIQEGQAFPDAIKTVCREMLNEAHIGR